MENSLYLPVKSKIIKIKKLTELEKYFKLDLSEFKNFKHNPGQFVQVAIPGAGEAPISISSFSEDNTLELVVRKAGSLTGILHGKKAGDIIGLRGPFGNGFPMETMKGKFLLLVAGGIGLVPLRSVIQYFIKYKNDFSGMTIFYGAKTDKELLFIDEYTIWKDNKINLHITIDRESPSWKGNVGLITSLFKKVNNIDYKNCKVLICGPPVMYKFVLIELMQKNVLPSDIYLSLERHMKCGVGKCAHCAFGSYHVCIDGPVFTYEFLREKKEAI